MHPGEVLLEEFLIPMNQSQNRLTLDIRVPTRWIGEFFASYFREGFEAVWNGAE